MVKKLAIVFVSLALLGVVLLTSSESLLLPVYGVTGGGSGDFWDSWFQLVHLSFNGFGVWKLDPLTALAATFSPGGVTPGDAASLITFAICFSVGTALVLASGNYGKSFIYTLPLGIVLSGVFLCLFGNDFVLLQSVMWFPFYLVVLTRSCVRGLSAWGWSLTLIPLTIVFCESANQYSLLLLGLAFIVARGFSSSNSVDSSLSRFLCFAFMSVGYACFGLYRMPHVSFPSYPMGAMVVPDDGIPGQSQPYFGSVASIPLYNWEALRGIYSHVSAIFIPLVCFIVFFLWKGARRPERAMLRAVLALTLVVGWDTALSTELSLIGPAQSLARLLPGVFYMGVAPVLFAVALLLFFVCAVTCGGTVIALVSLLILSMFSYQRSLAEFFTEGITLKGGRFQVTGREVAVVALQEFAKRSTNGNLQPLTEKLFSPSYAMLNREGLHVLQDEQRYRREHEFRSPKGLIREVESSVNSDSEVIHRAVDGDRATRWSTGYGRQVGDEWLRITFLYPLFLDGVELQTGDQAGRYSTDFPRGLRIKGWNKCDRDLDRGEPNMEFSWPHWPGPILLTDDGYPYYGSQSDVRVVFPKSVEVRCLEIQQIGTEPAYEWSVTELLILEANSIVGKNDGE